MLPICTHSHQRSTLSGPTISEFGNALLAPSGRWRIGTTLSWLTDSLVGMGADDQS